MSLALSRRALLGGAAAAASIALFPGALAAQSISPDAGGAEADPSSVGGSERQALVRRLVEELDPNGPRGGEDRGSVIVDLSAQRRRWPAVIQRFGTPELALDLNHGVRFNVEFAPGSALPGPRGRELLEMQPTRSTHAS